MCIISIIISCGVSSTGGRFFPLIYAAVYMNYCPLIANEKGFTVVCCKAGDEDHVHCFVSAPPKLSVTQIVKYLKGISGNILLKEFPQLRKFLWKGQLWNGSYFCETIGSTSEENILKYIERQKNCQL